MQPVTLLSLALLFTSQAIAAPAAEHGAFTPKHFPMLTKRANPVSVTCGRKFPSYAVTITSTNRLTPSQPPTTLKSGHSKMSKELTTLW